MAKITEKMPTDPKTISVVVPQDVKSVTITFDSATGTRIESHPTKQKAKKICD